MSDHTCDRSGVVKNVDVNVVVTFSNIFSGL